MRRRDALAAGAAAAVLAGGVRPARAQQAGAGSPRMRVWRDPHCGCCADWVAHARAAGFDVEDAVVPSVAPVRRRLGTPPELLSCHAALVEGYALEGHVPAVAVRRLLAERPPGVRGLAVPGMPVGSPGMEVPGQADEAYDVVAFGAEGPRGAFMRFRGGRPL